LMTDGGLRDVQPIGRARDALGARHCRDETEVPGLEKSDHEDDSFYY
jgi:hypothetical protein